MLIRQYGTIENLLTHAHEITKPKLKQSLIESADRARLSRELAQLHADVPLAIDYEALKTKEPDNAALLNILRELEFTALLKYVAQEPGIAAQYHTVLEESDFQSLVRLLSSIDAFCFDTETTSLDPMQAELVGMSFSVRPYEAYYLPLGHVYPGAPEQISRERALAALKTIFENPSIKKIGQNIKYDCGARTLRNSGLGDIVRHDDRLYLQSRRASHSLDMIALNF
jgi:DNA polymerase-1